MEKPITKDVLQNELFCGQQFAVQLLYTRYSGMLYGYILQFIPDKLKAEGLLVDIFSRLSSRLQEACDSSLSIYCWLQVEARKIILEHTREDQRAHSAPTERASFNAFFREGVSPEHERVFSKLFLQGMDKEDLALQEGKDLAYINQLLRESFLMIRERLR